MREGNIMRSSTTRTPKHDGTYMLRTLQIEAMTTSITQEPQGLCGGKRRRRDSGCRGRGHFILWGCMAIDRETVDGEV